MKGILKPKLTSRFTVLAIMVPAIMLGLSCSPLSAYAATHPSHAATHPSRAQILDRARLLNDGVGFIDVGVAYRCTGTPGTGTAVVTATQTATQSGAGVAASGTSNTFPLNCDGKPHTIGIDVPPSGPFPGFNVGKATAYVTLTAPSGTAIDMRAIRIVR